MGLPDCLTLPDACLPACSLACLTPLGLPHPASPCLPCLTLPALPHPACTPACLSLPARADARPPACLC